MEFVLNKTFATIAQETLERPSVCLTWAQSLDGKLGVTPGTPTVISGPQSMQMTHALRALHDSILVGVGTARADNPRLTCRMNADTKGVVDNIFKQYQIPNPISYDPVPVVLDSKLCTPLSTKFFHTPRQNRQPKPMVFCSEHQNTLESTKLLNTCAEVISVPQDKASPVLQRGLNLHYVLKELRRKGYKRLMVEGGASVLSSFLNNHLWDIAVVTVAPTIFDSGVCLQAIGDKHSPPPRFRNTTWTPMGEDVVMIGYAT